MTKESTKVLVACEYSGRVREAFRARGFDAWSCDLLPSEDNSPYHIQGDVLEVLKQDWTLMVAHPPCTRLCNSGVRWLAERNLWSEMEEGVQFFLTLLNAPIPHIGIENPVMHKHAKQHIGGHTFTIQPWQFGHGEVKRTCFWTKDLPPLTPTNIVDGREPKVHFMSPSPDRWKERSRTYQGIADAIADQWGNYVQGIH